MLDSTRKHKYMLAQVEQKLREIRVILGYEEIPEGRSLSLEAPRRPVIPMELTRAAMEDTQVHIYYLL